MVTHLKLIPELQAAIEELVLDVYSRGGTGESGIESQKIAALAIHNLQKDEQILMAIREFNSIKFAAEGEK